MKIKLLYSSSSGNSAIIESGSTAIMMDAGISYKKIKEAYGDDPKLNAILISHEHGDHIGSAGIVSRKTGAPVYLPQKSFEKKQTLFDDCVVNFLEGGETVEIGDFSISAFSTRHDSVASNGYVFTEKATMKKFGFLTDTGGITKLMRDSLQGCNGYFIESDYDEEELEKCAEYDDILKERIRSPYGHLSNQQSLEYVNTYLNLDTIEFIAFGHLSKNTNSPEIMRSRIEHVIPKKYWDKLNIINQTTEFEI
jgi:phosphoribosyl 1,2-cyclic phosphodiesterase